MYCLSFKSKPYSGQQPHQSRSSISKLKAVSKLSIPAHFACLSYFLPNISSNIVEGTLLLVPCFKGKVQPYSLWGSLHEKWPNAEFLLSLFSHIRTEHGIYTVNHCIQSKWRKKYGQKNLRTFTAQKKKFFIKDFFSNCRNCRFGYIYWRNLKWKTFCWSCVCHFLRSAWLKGKLVFIQWLFKNSRSYCQIMQCVLIAMKSKSKVCLLCRSWWSISFLIFTWIIFLFIKTIQHNTMRQLKRDKFCMNLSMIKA